MKNMLLSIVRMLVDHPGDIQLSQLAGDSTVIFELRCHADDVGKVIGKDGKMVTAIRTLLNGMAAREGRRAVVEVVE